MLSHVEYPDNSFSNGKCVSHPESHTTIAESLTTRALMKAMTNMMIKQNTLTIDRQYILSLFP